MDAILGVLTVDLAILFDEVDELRPLDLDGLAGAIVQGDDEVEEVALAQVVRRLFLKVRPGELRAERRRRRFDGQDDGRGRRDDGCK